MIAKQTKGRPPKVRDFAKEAAIAEDYRLEMPLSEIAEKHGIKAISSIYTILARMGVPLRAGRPTNDGKQGAA